MFKTVRLICAILAITMCGVMTFAQPTTSVASQVIALERQAMDGWLKGNPEPMLSRLDPEVTYFHEVTGSRLEGIAAVRQMCEPYRGRPLFDSYDIDAPKVRVSGDTAILSYQLVTHNGAAAARWNMTQVYERTDNGWRVIHIHNSRTPGQP